jgi:phosphoribosylaminoimidazole-succinocarboxamide synthase
LFQRGTEIAASRGLILVDTKYEFGKTKDGQIVLIDEIHTQISLFFMQKATKKDKIKARSKSNCQKNLCVAG